MQFAKDSFYVTLRERLAEVNPARTTVVDGGVAPRGGSGGKRVE